MKENQDALVLKNKPNLGDFQSYVRAMVRVRGFEGETISQLFMMLSEETGEMAKAARKHAKIKIDENSDKPELAFEIADVFIYLLAICNYFDIDLEKAFRDKEEINKKRIWK